MVMEPVLVLESLFDTPPSLHQTKPRFTVDVVYRFFFALIALCFIVLFLLI